jgi:hypothetical protein
MLVQSAPPQETTSPNAGYLRSMYVNNDDTSHRAAIKDFMNGKHLRLWTV